MHKHENKFQLVAVLQVGKVTGNCGDCGELENTRLVSGGGHRQPSQ